MDISFQTRGHDVVVESFFSKLTHIKMKTRKRMSVQSLCYLEIFLEDLVRNIPLEHQKTQKRKRTAPSEE